MTRKADKKKMKASLVQTRKVIAGKFRKLHTDRLQSDRKLKERYGILSDSLKKIINNKEEIQRKSDSKKSKDDSSNETPHESSNESSESDLEPNIDDAKINEPLITSKIEPMVDIKPIELERNEIPDIKRERRTTLENNNVRIKKRKSLKNDNVFDIKTKIKKEIVSDFGETDVEMKPFENLNERKKKNGKRKMKREQIKFNEKMPMKEKKPVTLNEINDIFLEAKRNRNFSKVNAELISKNADSAKIIKKLKTHQKKQQKRRNQTTETRKLNRNTNFDALRKEIPSEMVAFSPEDFDDDADYNLPGVKRSRISVPLSTIEKSIRKIKARKYKSNVKSGEGLERKFIPYSENIVYEYYDDPNELCDRLRLLISSKKAGNTNHDQEINSIIEELRERNIIV